MKLSIDTALMSVTKIGLVVGSGDLPQQVVSGAIEAGKSVYICAVKGFADHSDFGFDGDTFGIGEFGRLFKALRANGCDAVCFAGTVTRPNFKTLKPDWGGIKMLPGALNAARKGDEALLSFIVNECEKQGLSVIAPQILCQNLLVPSGALGMVSLSGPDREDALKAVQIARATGGLDIGQGAIVCRGLVLAVEAQEGTDAMIARISDLPPELRGRSNGKADGRAGVLAKVLKPQQDARLDLPTLGVKTVEGVVAAGLSAIVVVANQAFIIDKARAIDLADANGICIYGLDET